jgi:hypothetical protein
MMRRSNDWNGLALLLGAPLLALTQPVQGSQMTRTESGPVVLRVPSTAPEKNEQLSTLIASIRSKADGFVFLSGGASRMQEDHQRQLLAIFQALRLVANSCR